MSLRVRMGFVAGLAVAIAVIAVACSAYAGTRSQLRDQLDDSLEAISQPLLQQAGVNRSLMPHDGDAGAGAGSDGQGGAANGGRSLLNPSGAGSDCDAGLGLDHAARGAFGTAQGFKELIRRDGRVCVVSGEQSQITPDTGVRRLAAAGSGYFFSDVTSGGVHLRVLASGVRWRGALLVALPLTEVDRTLSSELLLLVLIATGGVLLAAVLGVFVARTALAPIGRFTRQAEAIAQRPDRIEHDRLEVSGDDELARLGRTFNATLDALESSIHAQRNLVADASHELRTPIASIRANLQLMRDEALLGAEDREALRADVIAELDELTALVGDVVELARGSKLAAEPGELRLDEIVADALQRARRRAPQVAFEATFEPTLVCGDGERIARAITNLLDNAAKWSPAGEAVEVTLRDGVVTVRDHGPGFNEDDLPFVFDRFHRAKEARSKPGSGLGLAIVRQATEAHSGLAEASNAPGGGALLRVSFGPALPLPDAEPQAAGLA